MLAVLDTLAGLLFVAVGLAAVRRSWRHAIVCTGAAIAWLVAPLAGAVLLLHRPLLLHAALGHPDGRLSSGSARALLVVALDHGRATRAGRASRRHVFCSGS